MIATRILISLASGYVLRSLFTIFYNLLTDGLPPTFSDFFIVAFGMPLFKWPQTLAISAIVFIALQSLQEMKSKSKK